ncbi:MAG TPA: hypothetical protein VHT53_05385 [Candidatus Elarobacter sp.]|jgi:hypothetical protein|nr:hypothetical protein [Candidatus Elarobacter sp.]
MADRVFGPHVSGLTVLGIHIGATVEVFRDDSAGPVPKSLSLVLSSPLGQSSTIANVADGAATTVPVASGVTVSAQIDDCRTQAAQGTAPALFLFKVTLRAQGTVKIALFPLPLNVQIDSFDVAVPVDAAAHRALLDSIAAP